MMIGIVSMWSHLLAAALYGALALLQLRRWNQDPLHRPLVTAFAVVSVWTIFLALLDPNDVLTQLGESARNLAFLAFLYGIVQSGGPGQRAIKAVYAAVAAVIGLQIVVGGILNQFAGQPLILEPLQSTHRVLGMTISAGALILVHNLYGQAAPASRRALRLPMIALAGMWGYDLHLYTVAHFSGGSAADLFAMRGAVLAMLVPLFVLATREVSSWRVQVSRAATFQSISIIFILIYLVVMMSASRALEVLGGDWLRMLQLSLVALMTATALLLLASPRARGWLRVVATKHIFEHRYDYRTEWLRFTDTVGRESNSPLEERVVKALADIGNSPGGLLLTADSHYRLTPFATWNWKAEEVRPGGSAEILGRYLERQAHVLDFDRLRAAPLRDGGQEIQIPDWLTSMESAWAGIPLLHGDRLVGLVVLAHPPFRRPLDWEDFDLFRAAGIQAASYIAEARGQQALADARRFDEFNRRFAFILHDIKNLVSQLSLVARNAERHADNPDFRADMVATLQASVKKLNDLMARLSPGATRETETPRATEIAPLVEAVAGPRRRNHPIDTDGSDNLLATADRRGLEQALSHLVQNAIEASEPDSPVRIRWFESGGDIAIEISDRGRGMTEDFVRTRLFQPFVSTKQNGFGIGAFEARALVHAMGGRLDVESASGEGTRFTLFLPAAEPVPARQLERMRA